ncbi:aminotransferase-like domain-containing protein [Rhizobium sp. Leaf341]|uniref:aminotransferase-like domain-containing protein n=1 Tax=Rhizobium sp. Leaf341 TaxID=1736344 RepID=UPI001FCD4305|nr:PLP-dependent aminotransferase family protein [Rhizobium sp. Leaf341]
MATTMVMETVRQRIAGRALLPGGKLPSIRKLAAVLKVSTSTVVEAYDRLVGEGLLCARPGSGFYVTQQAGAAMAFSVADAGPKRDRAVDPFWVSRQSLEAAPGDAKPGCGWLPPDWLPEDSVRRALRTLSRAQNPILSEYGSPLGLTPLRNLIGHRMAERGIAASPDQILLMESGTQAIDMLCRLLLQPGDTVLVDDPCYFNFHALLRAHRARIVGVPYTPSGPDTDAFARVVEEQRPRLYITNSAIHNPTGAILSPVAAHRVLKLAEANDVIIIEDDIFADLENSPAPRLAAFDGFDRVIHIGSFSKTLSASGRCGFIAAKPEWIDSLTDLKIATTFGGGRLTAELVYAVLSDGSYRKHLETLRQRLAKAMHSSAVRLKSLGITPWIDPQAGMFLWCRLPDEMDATDVARAALGRGLVLAPGNAFSLSQTARSFMRFNVAQMQAPAVFDILRDALAAQRGRDIA